MGTEVYHALKGLIKAKYGESCEARFGAWNVSPTKFRCLKQESAEEWELCRYQSQHNHASIDSALSVMRPTG